MSYHIISYHITSHHITSHHIASHQITSHHIKSHHITSHHITSHHIILYYIMFYYILGKINYILKLRHRRTEFLGISIRNTETLIGRSEDSTIEFGRPVVYMANLARYKTRYKTVQTMLFCQSKKSL